MSVGIGVGANLAHVLAVPLVGVPNTVPVVSDVVVTDTTATTATITWTTQIPASSQVRFGTTTLYGQETDVADTAPPVTSHGVIVTGLIEGTDYNFQVVSRNAFGTPGVSANGTFTTDDVTGPVISNAAASETRIAVAVALGGAKITGTFDTVFEPGSTWWVASVNSDMSSPAVTTAEIDTSPRKTTGHSQEITGLLPATLYYLRPHTKDAAGNETTGAIVQVTTTQTPISLLAKMELWLSAKLETGADLSGTQTPQDWTNKNPSLLTQATVGNRPTLHNAGDASFANGKPTWSFNGTTQSWIRTADVDAWDFTADRAAFVIFTRAAGLAAKDVFISKSDVTTNTLRWAYGITSAEKLYVFNDGKGSDQVSTASVDDGLNHMAIWNRVGTGTDLVLDGTTAVNSYTGMSNTAATGTTRVGAVSSGANLLAGMISEIILFNDDLTAPEIALLYAYAQAYYVTVPDLVAPVISGFALAESKIAEGVNGASVTGAFTTDEIGKTQLEYSLNPDMSSSTLTTEIDTSPLVLSHAQAITGRPAGTTIYVRAISRDAALNSAPSAISSLTTSWTPAAFGADCVLWIDAWLGYHVTGLAEGATTDPLDWSGAGHTFTSLAKPSFLRFGMNGAPCWDFVEGDTDHWDEADVLDLDLTGACFIGLVYRADTPVTNPTPLIVHGNTTPFAVQWGLQLATDGTIQFVTSGGGTQSSTSTQFSGPDEGGVVIPNVAVAINRDGSGNAQLYANGAAHDLFAGATSGNATGPIRFGINAAGTVHGTFKLAHALVVNRQIDAGELANWWGYVG